MEHRALLRFLILFLGFSYVVSSLPIPQSSAFLKSGYEEYTPIQEFMEQGLMDERNYGGKGLELDEAIIRGRMDIETNDYPGTGANNNHDPRSPGRS
ncbi:uncharacterized protein LOC122087611 [Macadamia integrifolia]|uniref:uncharacterized protein LOC122087611 n=1 Tax=Macadamia integrifolia TaxID=60698 RepID=UPI001C4E439C|nr:uncharacterized protein LOC122087611 [Macadamia integrifolia]